MISEIAKRDTELASEIAKRDTELSEERAKRAASDKLLEVFGTAEYETAKQKAVTKFVERKERKDAVETHGEK
jgi:hypothetical protein